MFWAANKQECCNSVCLRFESEQNFAFIIVGAMRASTLMQLDASRSGNGVILAVFNNCSTGDNGGEREKCKATAN